MTFYYLFLNFYKFLNFASGIFNRITGTKGGYINVSLGESGPKPTIEPGIEPGTLQYTRP